MHEGKKSIDTARTDTGRVPVELVGFGCVERDDLLPGVEDERVIGCGLSVLSDGEKGKRDCPITP